MKDEIVMCPTCRGSGNLFASELARLTWQPIDTAPKDGTRIQLWVTAAPWWRGPVEGVRYEEAWWQDGQWVYYCNGGDPGDMPIEWTNKDGRRPWCAVLWLPIVPDPPRETWPAHQPGEGT
jgi:hypothetical protein